MDLDKGTIATLAFLALVALLAIFFLSAPVWLS